MQVDDVRRILLGSFVRPPEETGTAAPRVEAVYGYLIVRSDAVVLLDTGIGQVDAETEAWYRPQRIPLEAAVRAAGGIEVADVSMVVNCHLHFDHCGGNTNLAGVPIICQRTELDTARTADYTIPELIDFPGARYELLDGDAEVLPGLHVIPTPGHVAGHQSLVVECTDGSIVLAGQSHDTASAWNADAFSARARELGHEPPLPTFPAWMDRLLAFDPQRVYFAHDGSVWMP